AKRGPPRAAFAAGIDQLTPPVGVVEEIRDFPGEIEMSSQMEAVAPGRILDVAVFSQVDESEGNSQIVGLARPGGKGESGILVPIGSGGSLDQPEVRLVPMDAVGAGGVSGAGDILLGD